ncbi:MAG: hypothetical protein IPK50_07685 [Fibrobacterota bacterium]|nr:MAG: hypothetical protein IPK50_07685 [Fibrobacterota bacterium]
MKPFYLILAFFGSAESPLSKHIIEPHQNTTTSRIAICTEHSSTPLDTINISSLIAPCDSYSIATAYQSISLHESKARSPSQAPALCNAYSCAERPDSAIPICTRALDGRDLRDDVSFHETSEHLSSEYLKLKNYDSASKYTDLTIKAMLTRQADPRANSLIAKKEAVLLRHSYILGKLNLFDSAIAIILPQYHKILFERQLEWLVTKRYTPDEIRSQLETAVHSVDWSVSERTDTLSYYRRLLGLNHHPSNPDSGVIKLFNSQAFLHFSFHKRKRIPTRDEYIQDFTASDFFYYLYCQ